MGNADPDLSPLAHGERLSILAFAPVPFLSDGAQTFHGGATVFYAELLPRLAHLGHRVRVIAEAPPAREGERRAGLPWEIPNLTVSWFAYEHYSSLSPPTPVLRARMRSTLRRLLEQHVKEERPDVVLIGRDLVAPHVLAACRAHDLPCVLIAHGVALAALLRGAYASDLREELLDSWRSVDGVVSVARHIEAALRSLGVARIRTIPNVADPTRFCPRPKDSRLLRQLDIRPERVVVGHVSVLRPAKRASDIVEAAALVLRSHPEVVYLVVGDGPCRLEMEELAEQRGTRRSFRFTGAIDHERVPEYFGLCDIVVLPSEREGYPFVYRETQASGRVLLASDIAPAYEAIVPDRTGVLFRKGDIADLAEKMVALARDPARRRRIGEAARAAAKEFGAEQWAEQYAKVLQQVKRET